MSGVNRFFNGTVLNVDSAPVLKVVGISYKDGGQWIDVTVPEDAAKLYQLSTQDDFAIQLKYKGSCALTRGGYHTSCSLTWADGTTSSMPGTWQVGPIEKTGDWDAPVTGSVELRPSVPQS
jgi:hypothetical protein